jgi:hypothetical protein
VNGNGKVVLNEGSEEQCGLTQKAFGTRGILRKKKKEKYRGIV